MTITDTVCLAFIRKICIIRWREIFVFFRKKTFYALYNWSIFCLFLTFSWFLVDRKGRSFKLFTKNYIFWSIYIRTFLFKKVRWGTHFFFAENSSLTFWLTVISILERYYSARIMHNFRFWRLEESVVRFCATCWRKGLGVLTRSQSYFHCSVEFCVLDLQRLLFDAHSFEYRQSFVFSPSACVCFLLILYYSTPLPQLRLWRPQDRVKKVFYTDFS